MKPAQDEVRKVRRGKKLKDRQKREKKPDVLIL